MSSKSSKYDAIIVDAVNTIIHKPSLSNKILNVLRSHDIDLPTDFVMSRHKLVSELIQFPDRTSRDFYSDFNSRFLESLGILATSELVEEIFQACSYLPWAVFDDVQALQKIGLPIAVLSNFSTALKGQLAETVPLEFMKIVSSESIGHAKPTTEFYRKGMEEIGFAPERCLYIGDSIRLDVIPGSKIGLNCILVDRLATYPANPTVQSISSFEQLQKIVQA